MTQSKRRWLFLGALAIAGCAATGVDFSKYDTAAPGPDAAVDGDGGVVVAAVQNDAGALVELATFGPLAIRRGGNSGSLTVSIARNGVAGAIDLTVTGLPTGVTASPVTIAAIDTSAVLTFTADESAELTTSTVTVHAALGALAEDDEPLQLTVSASRLDPTFGDGGIVLGAPNEIFQDFDLDSAEKGYVAVVAPPAGGLPRSRFVIYEIDSTGAATTALLIRGADTFYRISRAPTGAFFVLDVDGQHLDLYEKSSGVGAWSAVLPDVMNLTLERIRTTPEGNVVLIADGQLDPKSDDNSVLLARYMGDGGNADLSFGDAGLVMLPLNGEDDQGVDLIMTDAGTVACISRALTTSNSEAALTRFTSGGKVDRAFADGGAIVALAGRDVTCDGLTTDGRFIAAALTVVLDVNDRTTSAGVARMTIDGMLDPSFGSAGLVTNASLGSADSEGVAIGANGNLYSAGHVGQNSTNAALFENLGDGGQPNLLFGLGDGGAFPFAIGVSSDATAVRVLGNGSVLVTGSTLIDGTPTWFIARLLP